MFNLLANDWRINTDPLPTQSMLIHVGESKALDIYSRFWRREALCLHKARGKGAWTLAQLYMTGAWVLLNYDCKFSWLFASSTVKQTNSHTCNDKGEGGEKETGRKKVKEYAKFSLHELGYQGDFALKEPGDTLESLACLCHPLNCVRAHTLANICPLLLYTYIHVLLVTVTRPVTCKGL